MPRQRPAASNDPTSRIRTAEMLRRLRQLTREARMLRADIETARPKEAETRIRQRQR